MHLSFRNTIFWDVTFHLWISVSRHLGWKCRLNVQGFKGAFHVDYLRRRRHFLHWVGNCLVRNTSSHSTRNESSITPLFKPQNSLNCHSAYENSVRNANMVITLVHTFQLSYSQNTVNCYSSQHLIPASFVLLVPLWL